MHIFSCFMSLSLFILHILRIFVYLFSLNMYTSELTMWASHMHESKIKNQNRISKIWKQSIQNDKVKSRLQNIKTKTRHVPGIPKKRNLLNKERYDQFERVNNNDYHDKIHAIVFYPHIVDGTSLSAAHLSWWTFAFISLYFVYF